MKKKADCDHIVGSSTSSLSEPYGAYLEPVLDTEHYVRFHGYRECFACKVVFHMGTEVFDETDSIIEKDGIPISETGVWRQLKLWELEDAKLKARKERFG